MPGKLFDGSTDETRQKEAWAYCEGFGARVADAAQSANPHSQTGDPVAYRDWDNGWLDADALEGTVLTGDNCGGCAGSGQTVPVQA